MSRKRSPAVIEDLAKDDSPSQRKQRVGELDKENSSGNEAAPAEPRTIRAVNPAGRPPEAGVIKKVYVENLMCHRKLTVDLCRNVNFIHGQNGSGKSAVLAAIQVCLGAGARRTHRARNLKELVRKEAGDSCTGAKIRVTLLNGGPDGFQQDVYGDTITVERTISLRAGGSNGYRLLDHNGVSKSTSKKDLDAMLDHLNIQVENPVAVLDQEEAKKFLTGKPEDKYSFFTKATELERIDRSYANVIDNINQLQNTKEKVQQSLQGKVENVRLLKKEWEQYQELDKLDEQVLDYKVDYAWAFYSSVQNEVEIEEEKLQTFRAKREKREQELTQVESLTNGPDEEQERKQELMDQLIEEANEAANTKRALEGELKRAQAPVKVKQRELNQIEKEQGHAARSLQKVKHHLQEERERILAASGQSDEAKRVATLKKAEEELDQTREKLQQLKQSSTANQRKYDELGPSIEQARSQGDSIKNQLGGIQTKIKQLESSDTDSLAMFGRTCAKVDRLVKQAHREKRWTGPVAGPIGAHIKIASGKEQFASIAEQALGNSTLGRFVVTNDNDRKLLQHIREQAGCPSNECGIFQVAESPRYRVPPPPAADVETLASCLNIEDDLVFNALVDHARIDQRALCASKEISERSLLDKDGHGRLTIRGGTIKEVFFLPHGDKWSIMNNNLAMVSNERQLKKTLGVDKSAAVVDLKAEADQLLGELKRIRDQQTQLEMEQKDYQKKWNADRSHLRKSQQRAEQLSDTIEQIKAEAEEAATVTVDTTELEDDVSKAEQVVEAIEQQKSMKQRDIDELLPGVQDITNRLVEVSARNEKVLADMNAAEQDLATYLQTLSQRQAQLDKKRAKVEQMQEIITKQDSNVQKLVTDRDSALHKARLLHYRREFAKKRKGELEESSEMSPSATDESALEPPEDELLSIEPVQPPKEPAFYRSKIVQAQARIEKEKKRRRLTESHPEVAFQKYIRAQKDLDANMQQITAIDGNVELLAQDLKDRKRRWKQFRSHIATMSNVSFNEILNKKGSSGSIEFDHTNKTLDLVVQKDSSQASQTKDVKALSGGERSFTTLSLLLALGERLETPFRVMDEFDVFLDPVARKIALDTLVEVAKSMVHRQFIFITPQDLSALKTDPLLKIHYMKPPEREVRAGGPSQQTLDFGSQASS